MPDGPTFTVTAARPGWVWTNVTATADEDVHLNEERLGWDRFGAPGLEHWSIHISCGEAISADLPRERALIAGDKLNVPDLAHSLDFRSRWQRIASDDR